MACSEIHVTMDCLASGIDDCRAVQMGGWVLGLLWYLELVGSSGLRAELISIRL